MADLDFDDEPTTQDRANALLQSLRARQAMTPQVSPADTDTREKFGNLETLIGGGLAPIGHSDLQAVQQARSVTANPWRNAMAEAALERAGNTARTIGDREHPVGAFAKGLVSYGHNGAGQVVAQDTTKAGSQVVDDTVKPSAPLRRLGKGGGGGSPSGPGEIYPGVTQDLLDHWSDELNAGHGYPKSAMNKAGQPLAKLIETNAFRRDPKNSAAVAGAGFGSDKKSLDKATEQFDATNGFIGTFDKNIGQLEKTIADLRSSNSPFLNKGLRWYQTNVEGDPKLSAFKTALTTVNSEGAKINSGQTGGGGTPISVIQEMEHNLPPDATPEQILTALRVLRQDSENRRSSLQKNLGDIRGRMSGKSAVAVDPHQAAADWARANPNDPDSKAVLAKAVKEGAK